MTEAISRLIPGIMVNSNGTNRHEIYKMVNRKRGIQKKKKEKKNIWKYKIKREVY